MVSVLLHGLVFGITVIILEHAPRIEERHPTHHYAVRVLKLNDKEPHLHWSSASNDAHPATHPADDSAPANEPVPGQQSSATPIPEQLLASKISARQTLIQPDALPKVVLPQEAKIPLVLMLAHEKIPAVKIVPPSPQPAAAPITHPTVAIPNREQHVADIQIASSASVADSLQVPASTTSPIALQGRELTTIPQTAIDSRNKPTPITVMSLSNVLVSNGAVTIPLANEFAAANISTTLTPGRTKMKSEPGHGPSATAQNGNGLKPKSGESSAEQVRVPGQTGIKPGAQSGSEIASHSGSSAVSISTPTAGPASASLPLNESGIARIELPKNGTFGMVVVGSSLADQYPETMGVWSNRLAYTVYLHMGLAKSWILQYRVPDTVQNIANNTRPDAPWPYLMMRPNISPDDLDADAIMVHGFINTQGRFDKLSVVFPPQFAETKFVLSALQQWQFRPAIQNGQTTTVEVLLIIPEEDN